MKVEDISICPEPDCPVCALERKLLLEALAHKTHGPEPGAERCVALAHAMARIIYAESKGDAPLQFERIAWLAEVTAKAVRRLTANDRVEH